MSESYDFKTNVLHMSGNRKEDKDSLDDFPTPPWATRALVEHILKFGPYRQTDTVWEPAANRGFMAEPLKEYFSGVYCSDIADYGYPLAVMDFLDKDSRAEVDWIITNPPYNKCEQFIHKACETAGVGCAFLTRLSFLETIGRYQNLYSSNPPDVVGVFSERVPMVKGRLDAKVSSVTAYCWMVWYTNRPVWSGTQLMWIPPSKKELTKPGDYPV
jgi:hypothetical protein